MDLTGKPKTRARLSSASSPRAALRSAGAPAQADVRRQAVWALGCPSQDRRECVRGQWSPSRAARLRSGAGPL